MLVSEAVVETEDERSAKRACAGPSTSGVQPRSVDADIPPYRGDNWQELLVNYFMASGNGAAVFNYTDYSSNADISEIRNRDHRMSHKSLVDNGYLEVIGGSIHNRCFRIIAVGKKVARAYIDIKAADT